MKIERIKLAELRHDDQNARTHDQTNLKAIAGSLEQFGQRKPIVITQDNKVVAGNGTLTAAKLIGWTEIDCVRVPADWTAEQIKAYALADNRTAELAQWDEQVMAAQLLDLQEAGFDIESFGFELVNPPVDLEASQEDEIPEQVEPRTKLGDTWQLGRHKIICGDSIFGNAIEHLMQGKKADLVLTDPPYRQDSSGGKNDLIGKAVNKVTDSIAAMIDFEPEPFLETLRNYFDKNMNAYLFCNKDLVPDYLNWAIKNKFAFNILFWKKPNGLPLADSHRPDVEYLIFIRKNAIWNNGLSNVSYSKLLEFSRENSTIHPTMKPVGLLMNEILISSNANGIVVDPFLGSGSTLIAAEKTNRICYGFELEPKYCDVIIQRWENLTGKKAELVNASR
jgi:site-specific DNA-methyltransferase (adenine-specific)